MLVTRVALAPVFLRVVDSSRLDEPYARPGVVFPFRVDLGDGVDELQAKELQDLVDRIMARSSRFGTVKSGRVFDKNKNPVDRVKAYEQYILTGNMRGGYVKPDARFGPRLTGYNGATTKPGLRWNGDDI